jgi:ribosomal protein L11 methyltransferase
VAYSALRFDIDGNAADALADALLDAGALSVDVSDPHAGTPLETALYNEPGEPAGERWPIARITALFAQDVDGEAALADAAARAQVPCPASERYAVAEQDWVRATQAQFKPIRINERLWIVPSWCAAPDPAAINLTLDPGLAFGTGSHPTTRLCLAWLEQMIAQNDRVLDYGCGSGILSIAAAKLGAGLVHGIDIDPQAIVASRANGERNRVDASFARPDAGLVTAGSSYDVVVANILANPLIVLAPLLAAHTRIGGRIVLSGVLDAQAAAVLDAYRRWFKLARWRRDGDWVALAGERVEAR